MFKSLKGKTVIVTGGSKGIGKGIAMRFAKVGCNVAVVSRTREEAQNTAKQITDFGTQAIGIAANVASHTEMKAMAEKTMEAFGRIDILCANAGIFPSATLAEMSEADYDQVMDTNVKGMFMAVTACLPYLKQQSHGRIIVTSSITGPITGFPGWSHYGASKSAQLGFIRSAAIELAPFNITVNAVSPGNVWTEGLDEMGEDYTKQMIDSIPAGFLGDPADIANGALFFATEEARYVTGQNMVIDGGQVLPESVSALEEMRKSSGLS